MLFPTNNVTGVSYRAVTRRKSYRISWRGVAWVVWRGARAVRRAPCTVRRAPCMASGANGQPDDLQRQPGAGDTGNPEQAVQVGRRGAALACAQRIGPWSALEGGCALWAGLGWAVGRPMICLGGWLRSARLGCWLLTAEPRRE